MSTEHYDLRFPDCNKSFSSSFHCSQTFKQWPVKWNNGNIATSVSTRWMWWKSSVILSAAQLGRLFVRLHVDRPIAGQRIKRAWKIQKHTDTASIRFQSFQGSLSLNGVAAVVMGVAHSTGRNSIVKKHWKRRKKKSWVLSRRGWKEGTLKLEIPYKKMGGNLKTQKIFYLDKTI